MYFSEEPSTNEDAELTAGIHTLPIIWIFNKDTWPADARAFSRPTHFLKEKPWGRGCCCCCLFPSSRASRSCRAPHEISRSPRLAHKAPVMQAICITGITKKILEIVLWKYDHGRWEKREEGAMTPVAQASAHQSCGAKHQDGRPMLFGFLVIFTHQYRLTELCILNAENVEKVYSRPFKQMSWPKQRRFSIILTINIMQPRGMSWQVSRCFKTSVVNVLQLLRPLI